jgi:hypothetical protein
MSIRYGCPCSSLGATAYGVAMRALVVLPLITLLVAPSTCRPKIAEGGMLSALRGRRGAGDLIPDRKRGGPRGPILGGGEVIAAEMEEVVDLVMSREEPLRLTG